MNRSALVIRILAIPLLIGLFAGGGCASTSPWYNTPDPGTVSPKRAVLAVQQPPSDGIQPDTFRIGASNAPAGPGLRGNALSAGTAVNPRLPSIFVAGDSTAARGAGERQQGWAVPFADYFDPAKVNLVNRARGGRSSRTFITEGLWDALLADVHSNDIVLIQFGHNDGGPVNDNSRARGSLPGLGEETEEIDNLITHKHELVHTFGWYMRKMINDTKAKGAKPIVLGLTVRDIWANGKVERGPGRYSGWSADIAQASRVPFVDLTTMVADIFDALGEDQVKLLYPQDHTHFNLAGAEIHAANVLLGLKSLPGQPVSRYLSAKGQAVTAWSDHVP